MNPETRAINKQASDNNKWSTSQFRNFEHLDDFHLLKK